jgi:endonuclease-3
MKPPFLEIIDALEKFYGPHPAPAESGPLEMVLLENSAYLVGDEQRERAFNALRDHIGLTPSDILSASPEELFSIAEMGGPMPELRVKKLCGIATTAMAGFDGDMRKILQLPLSQAKKALKKFPGIGDPGAEKILLFCRAYAVPAFESNGLRALTRLGFADSGKSYSAAYNEAREKVLAQTGPDFDLLIKSYHLLRRHGQELCKRKTPLCGPCPLNDRCPYFVETNLGFA